LRRFLAVLVVLVSALLLFRVQVLTALGHFLVNADTPRRADVIVVLGGDYYGERIMKACELVRQGFAPKAIISGPKVFFGFHEDRFAIEHAVARGCDPFSLEGAPTDARSTETEAQFFGDLLRRRGVRHYILLTSNFHTRRAAAIFRRAIPDMEATVVAAPHPEFAPDSWWKTREGQKVFFFEWTKTLTGPMGI
jgi:uncharacterized SAM-binding protein YcdF (DUF218 family)